MPDHQTHREAGPSTRVAHAGLPARAQGEPYLPGPVFAAPYHLQGPVDASRFGYGRYANPTWERLEAALGELEGGEVVVFASGMAAVSAVVIDRLRPGDVLVAPSDGYPGVRSIARDHLAPRGVEVRLVPTDHDAVLGATPGATVVWIETPSNPGLDVLDVAALARAAHDAGAELVVDNTLAGPLRQRALELGADVSVTSASKHLTGHSDLVLGYVAAREPERAAALRAWRGTTGAIPGPFEAWLAHRSLATLAVRLERQEASAAAILEMLRARDDVTGARWPGVGSVVCFTLESAERAQAFLAALTIVAEATSFGGLHSSAERRGRWGTDDVPGGFIRLSAGIEDTADLVADIAQALDATR
ncbi:MAG: cystathionine gamma-lyase [Solirubrobacteraceae bacterium]|nr:cystathionine gamma-lyase [Solirubrobacteraceae bacterium]